LIARPHTYTYTHTFTHTQTYTHTHHTHNASMYPVMLLPASSVEEMLIHSQAAVTHTHTTHTHSPHTHHTLTHHTHSQTTHTHTPHTLTRHTLTAHSHTTRTHTSHTLAHTYTLIHTQYPVVSLLASLVEEEPVHPQATVTRAATGGSCVDALHWCLPRGLCVCHSLASASTHMHIDTHCES
jgi:hypothetical protein